MSRQRIIYSSKAVRLGSTTVLRGVQSATYGFELNRTDVNAFGKLAALDRLLTQTPTVNTELQILAGDSANGAVVTKAQIMQATTSADLNISIGLAGPVAGKDPNQQDYASTLTNPGPATSNGNMITTLGNFVGSASLEASVGAFALCNLSFEGSGMSIAAGSIANAPATAVTVNTQEHVIVGFANPDENNSDQGALHGLVGTAQSANLNTNISREVIEKFGERYSATRLVQFPASASMTMEGLDIGHDVKYDIASAYSIKQGTGATATKHEQIHFNILENVGTDGTGGTDKEYGLKGATTDSVSFNGGIGDNHTISATFVSSIGEPGDTTHNFYWHGDI